MSVEPSSRSGPEVPELVVHQAVFSSAATSRGQGYQFLAWSPGVTPSLRQQLHPWAPTHDSLVEPPPHGAGLNFFLLERHAVVSWSGYAGQEYSGRGAAVFTHFLLAERSQFEKAGAHPFALLQAALGKQVVAPCLPLPETLPEVKLPLRPTWVELELLLPLRQTNPATWLPGVLAALEAGRRVVIRAEEVSPHVLARGLWSCLPQSLRMRTSFTTGLVPSLRRPFQLMVWERLPWSAARLRRQTGAVVVELGRPQEIPDSGTPAPWIDKVVQAVAQGTVAELLEHLTRLNRHQERTAEPPPVELPAEPASPDQLHC